jgi:hypothetical protein
MSPTPWPFKQRGVTRAWRATRAAGIPARIDILRDGTISIIPMTPQEAVAVEAPKPAPNAMPPVPGLRSWD